VIPAGQKYYVDINAITNLDVYNSTYNACGSDGSMCQPPNGTTAPVCDYINNNTLVPGAGLISAFSDFLTSTWPVTDQTSCTTTPALYAGCMTAPCTLTGTTDPSTGLALSQCTCPTFNGLYQIGLPSQQCTLGSNFVWSASYTVPPSLTQQIAAIMTELDSLVSSGDLTAGEAQSLGAKAEAASEIIQKHDNPAGKNILNAMLNQVNALLKSKRISSHTARNLSGAISNAIASL